jgi:hypothetical protein
MILGVQGSDGTEATDGEGNCGEYCEHDRFSFGNAHWTMLEWRLYARYEYALRFKPALVSYP